MSEEGGEQTSLESEPRVRGKQPVVLTHGLLRLSNTMKLMESTKDNQKHLSINTNKYKQAPQTATHFKDSLAH